MGECLNKNEKIPSPNFIKRKSNLSRLTDKSLFYLIKGKDKSKLSKLISENPQNYNPSDLNEDGETALIVACKHKKWVNAFTLLEIYGEETLPDFKSNSGYNAIYYASYNVNLTSRLLTYQSVKNDINYIYPNGDTLLNVLIRNFNTINCLNIIEGISLDNLNHYNSSRVTPLILASRLGQWKICQELIIRGATTSYYDIDGNSLMTYLLDNIENDLCKERIDTFFMLVDGNSNLKKSNEYEFNIYGESDFDNITELHNSSGNYGSIKWAIENKTGYHKILKHYHGYTNSSIITDDIIKEIVYIRTLNKNNNFTVRIDGFYIDENDNYYLVMEPLLLTVSNYFKVLSLCEQSLEDNKMKEMRITKLFDDLFSMVTRIHELGIIHNDLKLENIMIDYNGNLKICDFGISDFIGISPYKHVANNYIATSIIKAPDLGENITFNILDSLSDSDLQKANSTNVFKIISSFHFKSPRKSYESDIFSLGVSIIQGILMRNDKFISINEILYRSVKVDSIPSGNINIIKVGKNTLYKLMEYPFYKKLISMVNIDINSRLSRDILPIHATNYDSSNDSLINRFLHYSTNEINQRHFELYYFDKIVNNYKSVSLEMNPSKRRDECIGIFNSILSKINNKISIDTYYNSLYNSINYQGKGDIKIVCISYFFIFSYIFEWYSPKIDIFVELFGIRSYILISNINSMIMSLVKIVKIVPFITLVEQAIIKLQVNQYDIVFIKEVEKMIFDKLLDYISNKSSKEIIFINDFITFLLCSVKKISYESNYIDNNIVTVFSRFL